MYDGAQQQPAYWVCQKYAQNLNYSNDDEGTLFLLLKRLGFGFDGAPSMRVRGGAQDWTERQRQLTTQC